MFSTFEDLRNKVVNFGGFAWNDLLGQKPQQFLWTPVITFETPGDLTVVYSTQKGTWVRIGQMVFLSWDIRTTTFTHTTASGNLIITGAPFAPSVNSIASYGAVRWRGITKANFTDVAAFITAQTIIFSAISGSGQAATTVAFGDIPTGGTVQHSGSLFYRLD